MPGGQPVSRSRESAHSEKQHFGPAARDLQAGCRNLIGDARCITSDPNSAFYSRRDYIPEESRPVMHRASPKCDRVVASTR
ncbi:hypothetical protein GFS60_07039 (plasmid) [Rhodococcus sp. WAY2]|nr:hypothetical protein GFS60_07039 [Rhodococcus sp. WAY2]